jgi:hypothetical protein
MREEENTFSPHYRKSNFDGIKNIAIEKKMRTKRRMNGNSASLIAFFRPKCKLWMNVGLSCVNWKCRLQTNFISPSIISSLKKLSKPSSQKRVTVYRFFSSIFGFPFHLKEKIMGLRCAWQTKNKTFSHHRLSSCLFLARCFLVFLSLPLPSSTLKNNRGGGETNASGFTDYSLRLMHYRWCVLIRGQ